MILTLENAFKIKAEYKDLNIKVIEQSSKGKAGAVYEAIENSEGDLLAILDSDLVSTLKHYLHFLALLRRVELIL